MRGSRRLLLPLKEATEVFLDYLQYADRELPTLSAVFPSGSGPESDVVGFHRQLSETMQENGFDFVGIKVMPPSSEAVRALRGSRPVCVPLFSNFFDKKRFAVKQRRLQYVEPAICIRLADALPEACSVEQATACSYAFSAAIEVTGSRFPFFPPTLAALACDLGSCAGVALGEEHLLTDKTNTAPDSYDFVLTCDDEPIQVGGGKHCMGTPFAAVAAAAAYAASLGSPLRKDHLVLCNGVSPRSPAQLGKYTIQWGVYGDTSCTLV